LAKISELLTEFFDQINESADSDPKNNVVINWYNDCLDDLAEEAALEGTPQSLNTVSGTAAYALPGSNFVKYRRIRCGDNWLKPTSLEELASKDLNPDDPGTPTHYYIYNDQVYFYPVPDRVLSAKAWWFRTPAHVSASDTTVSPEILERFHSILNDYAFYRYQVRDSEPDLASEAYRHYARRKTALGKARREQQRRGRPTMGYVPLV
jgi:hypothetical protein